MGTEGKIARAAMRLFRDADGNPQLEIDGVNVTRKVAEVEYTQDLSGEPCSVTVKFHADLLVSGSVLLSQDVTEVLAPGSAPESYTEVHMEADIQFDRWGSVFIDDVPVRRLNGAAAGVELDGVRAPQDVVFFRLRGAAGELKAWMS